MTSIHYLFSKAVGVNMPITFVGNMPRLLASFGWTLHVIDTSEMKFGDLIFLKRKAESRLIIHAALVLSVDRVFNCRRDKGMVVESIDSLFEVYEQEIWNDQLIYIDYRDKKLRETHGGCYLKV